MKKIFVSLALLGIVSLSCKKDDKQENPPVVKGGLKIYTGLAFSTDKPENEYGKVFSTKTGKMYRNGNIAAGEIPDVDIVFDNVEMGALWFSSPDASKISFKLAGARTTVFINNPAAALFTPAMYDTLSYSSALTKLNIRDDDNSGFPITGFPKVVLFKNAAGKSGVIKITAIQPHRIVADIKVQE